MKKAILIVCVAIFSGSGFGQSNEIVPIILDGKPAYLNTTTGKVVSNKEALSKKYKKINLNDFPNPAPTANTAVWSGSENEHTVISGETLYSISIVYGLSVLELKERNQLDTNVLNVGQVLQLSNQIQPDVVENTNEARMHTVSAGETLYAISRKYNISLNKLLKLNNLTSNTISIGQELVVQ